MLLNDGNKKHGRRYPDCLQNEHFKEATLCNDSLFVNLFSLPAIDTRAGTITSHSPSPDTRKELKLLGSIKMTTSQKVVTAATWNITPRMSCHCFVEAGTRCVLKLRLNDDEQRTALEKKGSHHIGISVKPRSLSPLTRDERFPLNIAG